MITTYKKLFNKWLDDVLFNYVWHKAEQNASLDTLLNTEFDAGYGLSEGLDFVLITKQWIYFPSTYDGAEDVERMPRNPNEDFTPYHVGGE